MSKQNIEVTELIPTQKIRDINIKKVENIAKEYKKGKGLEKPIIYKRKGKTYIIDGHHRVLAKIRNKEPYVECEEIYGNNNGYGYRVDDVEKLTVSDYYDWEDVVKGLNK